MIPAGIDYKGIIADLNTWGIRDYKIELICGFTIGYIAQVKCGAIKQMTYPRAAVLFNFWEDEAKLRVSHETFSSQSLTATAT